MQRRFKLHLTFPSIRGVQTALVAGQLLVTKTLNIDAILRIFQPFHRFKCMGYI